jgi:hypothetical protein
MTVLELLTATTGARIVAAYFGAYTNGLLFNI